MRYLKAIFSGLFIMLLCSCQSNSENNTQPTGYKSFINKVEYGMPVYEFRELLKETSPDCYARLEHGQNCVFRFKHIEPLQKVEWSLYAIPWNNGNLQRFVLFNEFNYDEAQKIYEVLKSHLISILSQPDFNTQNQQQKEVKWDSDKRMVRLALQSNSNNKHSVLVYYMFKYH